MSLNKVIKHLQGQHSQQSHAGSKGSLSDYQKRVKDTIDYKGTIPPEDKIDTIIQKLDGMKSLSVNKVMDAADEIGVSVGFADHVAQIIKSDRRIPKIKSPEEARADRILRIRDSSGRVRARKM